MIYVCLSYDISFKVNGLILRLELCDARQTHNEGHFNWLAYSTCCYLRVSFAYFHFLSHLSFFFYLQCILYHIGVFLWTESESNVFIFQLSRTFHPLTGHTSSFVGGSCLARVLTRQTSTWVRCYGYDGDVWWMDGLLDGCHLSTESLARWMTIGLRICVCMHFAVWRLNDNYLSYGQNMVYSELRNYLYSAAVYTTRPRHFFILRCQCVCTITVVPP